ncbi:hypothetical protein B0T17DRAFT_111098 [Bombardia bombarda]|uniref:Uncharacterized protein n=1 Tax=Bombardia bombarda TaxID=252184 RepID=A0AA39U3S6_9PEZI|nr:hypothetical protein B0T17DRAFT_111098 [Bombardia bombarda]
MFDCYATPFHPRRASILRMVLGICMICRTCRPWCTGHDVILPPSQAPGPRCPFESADVSVDGPPFPRIFPLSQSVTPDSSPATRRGWHMCSAQLGQQSMFGRPHGDTGSLIPSAHLIRLFCAAVKLDSQVQK